MSRSIDKKALFELVGYTPHAGQAEVHASKAKRRVLACGVRWGKTTLVVHEALAALLAPTGPSRGWVVAPGHATTNLVVRVLFDLLEEHFGHRVQELSRTKRYARIQNLAGHDAELWAKAAARPDGLLGESLDWVVLDEAARLKPEIWLEHVSQRLVDRDGWALLASTPYGEGDWFHEEFLRGDAGDEGYASWARPTTENPAIDPEIVAREKDRLSPEAFHAQFNACFVGALGWVCPTCRWGEANDHRMLTFEQWAKCRACPDCGRPVDEHGKPVGAMDLEGHIRVQALGHVRDTPVARIHTDPILAELTDYPERSALG